MIAGKPWRSRITGRVIALNISIMAMLLVLVSAAALLAALHGRVYLPQLIIMFIATLGLSVLLCAAVMRRYVLKPLADLTESVSRISCTGAQAPRAAAINRPVALPAEPAEISSLARPVSCFNVGGTK